MPRRLDAAGISSYAQLSSSRRRKGTKDLGNDSIEKPPLYFAWTEPAPLKAVVAPLSMTAPVATTPIATPSVLTATPPISIATPPVSIAPPPVHIAAPQAMMAPPTATIATAPATIATTPNTISPAILTNTSAASVLSSSPAYFVAGNTVPQVVPMMQSAFGTLPYSQSMMYPVVYPSPQPAAPCKCQAAPAQEIKKEVLYPPNMTKFLPKQSQIQGKSGAEAVAYWEWLHWYASWQLYYQKGGQIDEKSHSKKLHKLMRKVHEHSRKSHHRSQPKESDVWWFDLTQHISPRHQSTASVHPNPKASSQVQKEEKIDTILTLEELAL